MIIATNILLLAGVLLVWLQVVGLRADLKADRLLRLPRVVVKAIKDPAIPYPHKLTIKLRLINLMTGLGLIGASSFFMFYLRGAH